jgi:glycosyltransferase involved in cell wall biosynthesis
VSIIVCVYNAGEYLRPSIESLLAQSYKNIEIFIVDDGSTDGCLSTIGDLIDSRITIHHQTNSGKPAAMNVALDRIGGEFYAVHDADDLSEPHRIERQVEALLANQDVAAVFCGNDLILGKKRMAPLHLAKDRAACRRDIERFRMPGHDPTAMYRVSMVRNFRYSIDLPIVEGYDYILRVGEAYPMLMLADCLYCYRIHAESVTHRNPARRDALVQEVLARACGRRGLNYDELFGAPARQRRSSRQSQMDNNVAAHFMESTVNLKVLGKYRQAIGTGLACVRLHPFDPHYYKALLYSIMPMWIVRIIRRAPE